MPGYILKLLILRMISNAVYILHLDVLQLRTPILMAFSFYPLQQPRSSLKPYMVAPFRVLSFYSLIRIFDLIRCYRTAVVDSVSLNNLESLNSLYLSR